MSAFCQKLSSHWTTDVMSAAACSLIAFYFESARRLTSEERLFAIRIAEDRLARARTLAWPALLREDWIVHHEFLTIDLMPFMRGASERLDDLAAARKAVTSSPDILGGTLVIRGTRVPVYDVAASLAAGHSTERVLETWPSLDEEKIRLASIYAEANPLRGRPRGAGEFPEGSIIIADRRVPPQESGMKFLIDECLSPELAKMARRNGYGETSHVVWMKLGGLKTGSSNRSLLRGTGPSSPRTRSISAGRKISRERKGNMLTWLSMPG